MGIKKRAVSDEQKLARKNHIQEAALKLFKTKSFNEINMDSIAKEANVAKGTVFFYFETKEELFLAIAKNKFEDLFNSINKSLTDLIGKNPKKSDLKKIIISHLKENSILTRLIAILNITLEKNINYETAYKFKKDLHDNILKTGQLIEKCMPSLKIGYGVKIMMWINVLMIGIQHITDPSKIIKEVIEKEGLKGFDHNFDELFIEMVDLIFNGME